VRLLIVSGERCPREAVRRWATPGRRMLNVYGPTETTVNATVAECAPDRDITIGKPLRDYHLHILDETGRRVDAGEQGELFITGAGVARGYLGQNDLTRKHFVELPVGPGRDRSWRSDSCAFRNAESVRRSRGARNGRRSSIAANSIAMRIRIRRWS
jgi:non-ribosomal peptide synthetase component F